MRTIPLIIDCDTGVDDAVALFLAFASPELDLKAITTVGGNVDAARTARNSRIIRQIARREDVPVHAGCVRPLVREPVEAGDFHGDEGLGTLAVFEPSAAGANEGAVDALIRLTSAPGDSVTVGVLGPMTNLATAMRRNPGLAGRLKRVVAMGGARTEGGNITASAEYNIFADPHAAAEVLASGVEVVMLGLDATHQVRVPDDRIAAIRAIGSPSAEAAAELLDFSQGTARRFTEERDSPLHDPCVIAWLLQPDLFTLKPCRIEVETASPLTQGHTAVEFRIDPATARHFWAVKADGDGVLDLIEERLRAWG